MEILYRANPKESEATTDDTAARIKAAVDGASAVASSFTSAISFLSVLDETMAEPRQDSKNIRERTLTFQILIRAA
jgi:hypothetical protein